MPPGVQQQYRGGLPEATQRIAGAPEEGGVERLERAVLLEEQVKLAGGGENTLCVGRVPGKTTSGSCRESMQSDERFDTWGRYGDKRRSLASRTTHQHLNQV